MTDRRRLPQRIVAFLRSLGVAAAFLVGSAFSGGCSNKTGVTEQAAVATPSNLEGFLKLKWTVAARPPTVALGVFIRQNKATLSRNDVANAILVIAQAGERNAAEALIDDVYATLASSTPKGVANLKHRIAHWYEEKFWPLQDDSAVDHWNAELQRLSQIGYLDDK